MVSVNCLAPEVFITFRVTQDEKDLLREYCDPESRAPNRYPTRARVRGLKRKIRESTNKKSLLLRRGFRPTFSVKVGGKLVYNRILPVLNR